MEFKYRVKNMEPFKDGNILGGRFLRPNEILVVTETEKTQIENSGGVLEVIDTLVPNPLKAVVHEEVVEPEIVEPVQEEVPVKRKAGRPRKNA